jgi:uncharacterized DUF497 family protein
MKFRFSEEKNSKLLAERGIGFDQISNLLTENKFLSMESNPSKKYPNQKIIYVPIDDEIYAVPCVMEEDGTFFLKTIFPSRVARKRFLKNKKPRT